MSFWLIIRTILSGIVVLYLQVLIMPKLAIAGVTPNLFLGWIVYQVWRKPVNLLIPILFFLGISYDLTMPTMLGLQTMVFVLLAVGVDEFHRPLEKDSYVTMAITMGLVVLIYSIFMLIVYGIDTGFSASLFLLVFGMILYNSIVSAISTTLYILISHLKLDFKRG